MLNRLKQPFGAGYNRYSRGTHRGFGRCFIAHGVDLLGGSSNKLDAVVGADLGKLRVFGKKTVAGMNGVGSGYFGSRNDIRNIEVRLAADGRANAYGLVGKAYVQAVAVSRGVNGHGLDAHLTARTDNAERDFASVGYEYFSEHRFRYK